MSTASALVAEDWSEQQEAIALLYAKGSEIDVIASALGLPKAVVASVLEDPRAIQTVQYFRAEVAKVLGEKVAPKLEALAFRAAQRIEETLDHTFVAGSQAKHHQDRLAMKLLEGKGFLKAQEGETGETITRRDLEKFEASMRKALEARELRATVLTEQGGVYAGEEAGEEEAEEKRQVREGEFELEPSSGSATQWVEVADE
jgi:hypothetical protein